MGLAALDLLFFLIPSSLPFNRPWFEFGPILFRTAVYLLVGYIINRLVRSQREQTTRLSQAYQDLSAFATTNEHLTLSRERNRLARELHDTLAHTLSAVAVQLEAVSSLWKANPEKAHQMLGQSLEMTRSGLAETRRAIQSLRAAPVEDMGLPIALTNLAQTFADRYQLKLETEIPANINDWGSEVETGFYRIAEESLRNIAQHAGAHTLGVTLIETNHSLVEVIRDDGRGFDPENPSQGAERFGLKGMKERATAIGADLIIDSQAGEGTTITLKIEKRNLNKDSSK